MISICHNCGNNSFHLEDRDNCCGDTSTYFICTKCKKEDEDNDHVKDGKSVIEGRDCSCMDWYYKNK